MRGAALEGASRAKNEKNNIYCTFYCKTLAYKIKAPYICYTLTNRVFKTATMTNTLNTKQALAAQIKTNGSQYNEHERLAYCLMYLSSLLMANQAATVMREFTRGDDKYKLGQRMKGRKRELSELAARVSSQGDGDSWRISEDRIETRCALIAEFAIMSMQFNDDDDTIDFFSDRIAKLKLEAQNRQVLINKQKNQ